MEMPAADGFMKEVRDNFLLCKLCSKDFDRPKTLPCMHTFCHECLVQYAGESKQTYRYSTYCKPISCPVCRKRTDITKNDIDALPDNFLISSLSLIIRDKSEDSLSCQICTRKPKGRKPTAVQRCLECNKQLCKRCVTQHQNIKVTQSHTLYSIENAHRLVCSEHGEEAVRFICKTCTKCICVFCTHTGHKGHDIMSILEGTATCQQEMEKTMETCTDRIRSINGQLMFIEIWEKCYKDTKEHIMAASTDFLTQVENQKQLILSKLDDLYGADVLDMLTKKEALNQSLEGLSSACQIKDMVPANYSIESLFLQNELQNKVKHLLDTPLPVSTDQLSSNDVNISFEKGGLSLGSLITYEGEEEPLYYDADEIEETDCAPKWCRRCRSRSRSRSIGIDMRRFRTRSLTPFVTDTEISLTDVSALGTMSPLLSTKNSMSYSSDINKVHVDTVDSGVQVDFHLRNGGFLSTSTQYDIMDSIEHRLPLDIPDVVSSTKLTTESSSQCEVPQTVESSSQHNNIQLRDSTCQSLHTAQVDSETQHFPQVADAVCQSTSYCHVNSGTQYKNLVVEPSIESVDSSCQHEAVTTMDSSSQYDVCNIVTVDAECQHNPNLQSSMTQYDLPLTTTTPTMTELTFNVGESGESYPIIGKDARTNTNIKLSPIVRQTDQASMKKPDTVNHYTMTVPPSQRHLGISTEAVNKVDFGTEALILQLGNQESQTISPLIHDVHTNTPCLPQLTDCETNTDKSVQRDQSNQTISSKMKSRGITARPSIVECGIEVKPSNSNVFTNTEHVTKYHMDTQTTPSTQYNKSTSTLPVACASRGITAHIFGVNIQTSTADLVFSQSLSTQTEHSVVDRGVGSNSPICSSDSSTNTSYADGITIACGPDSLMGNMKSVGVGTMPPPLNKTVGVNVGAIKTDSWTNPIVQPVSSKSCGTEKVRQRHVGLFVRPVCTDSSSMTLPPETKNKACGDNLLRSQSNKQLDTAGLIKYISSYTNTEPIVEKKVTTHSIQTSTVNMSDNYTVMLQGLLMDKATNTPHQLPQEILEQFQRDSPTTEQHNRAMQTEWTCDVHSLSFTCVSEEQSMLRAINPPTVTSTSVEGAGITQCEPHPPAPYSLTNSADPRSNMASKSAAVRPVMCDQSTSTATLSSLLHPDKSITDGMDNKISQCIVKLRQVTKKLQNSSTDINKSENSTEHSPATDFEHPAADDIRRGSDVGSRRRKSFTTISADSPPSSITKQESHSPDSVALLHGSAPDQGVSSREAAGQSMSTGVAPSPSMSHDTTPNQCLSYWPAVKLRSFRNDSTSSTASALTNATILRALKRFSKNKIKLPEVLATSTSTKPAPEQLSTQEQKLYSPPEQNFRGRRYSGPRQAEPTAQCSWDLKSLVHEEDRIKKAMRRSTEQLNNLPPSASVRSRKSSTASMESSTLSQLMFSAESSLYGSTESLNHSSASRGSARVVSSGEGVNTPANPSALSSGSQAAWPAPSSQTISSSSSVPKTKKLKTKARSKQLKPSALLGDDSANEHQRSKEKPVKNVSVKPRSKLLQSAPSAKSLVSSVVQKATTMNKCGSSSLTPPPSPILFSIRKSRSNSDPTSKKLSSDYKKKSAEFHRRFSAENPSLKKYYTDTCGQRLASHSRVVSSDGTEYANCDMSSDMNFDLMGVSEINPDNAQDITVSTKPKKPTGTGTKLPTSLIPYSNPSKSSKTNKKMWL